MNRKLHTVYKIVRTEGGAFWSMSFGRSDVCLVQYVPGQWVQAPELMRRLGYDLCVFRDLTDVCSFIARICWRPPSDWQLWRCHARGVHEPRVVYLRVDCVTHYVQSALDGCPPDIDTIAYGNWPPGTLFARAVRLIDPVPWDHELLR